MSKVPIDILSQVKNIRGCEGIIFTGSRQDGTATMGSDWDFYVLLDDVAKSFRKTWAYKDFLIEVFCNTYDSIKYHDLVRHKISNPNLTMLATGQILQDRNARLHEVQENAKKVLSQGPKELTNAEKQVIGYHLRMITDDLKSLEELNANGNYLQDDALAYFIECLYRLERKWMVKPREIDSDIEHINPKLAKHYLLAHEGPGEDRVAIIIELIEYLAKLYKVPFDGEIIQYRE